MAKTGILVIFIMLVAIVCLLTWPTLALVAFMSFGMIKSTMFTLRGFWGYIIDMGVVLIAVFSILKKCIFVKESYEGSLAPLAVWLYMLMLALWAWFRLPVTRDPEIGMIKVLIFSIFDMFVIFSGILFGRTKNGLRIICRAMIIAGAIAMVGVLIFGQNVSGYEGGRISLGQSIPLIPADMVAYSLIAMVGIWMAGRTKKQFLLMSIMVVAGLSTILKTGTRGPLFAFPAVFIVVAYFYRRCINFTTVISFVLLGLLLVGAFGYFVGRAEGIAGQRFGSEQITSDIMERIYMIKVTLAGWTRSPFLGTGPGDFAYQMTGYTFFRYPHNILLEVLNELGLVGFSFYVLLLYHGFRGVKLLSASWLEYTEYKKYAVIIFSGFLYHFIMSFKGGGYAGSNMFYFFWGASIGVWQLAFSEPHRLYEEYEYEAIETGEFAF